MGPLTGLLDPAELGYVAAADRRRGNRILPTYVYLNPGAYQATGTTATVPGGAVSATIVATPVKVVWSTGDGGSVTCPGQGVPYDSAWGNSPAPADSGACTYTYSDTSHDQPGGHVFPLRHRLVPRDMDLHRGWGRGW